MSPNVIQLRRMLAEKFPRLRARAEAASVSRHQWPTGLAQIDDATEGGLRKGALTEIIGNGRSTGSALLLQRLLRNAAYANQIMTLVDARDSLDVAQIEQPVLSRLLWIRSRSPEEAMKALDLVLRDQNLPLVFVDLAASEERQLRKIPATTWYRFQRLIEITSTVCLVFTPHHLVTPAQTQIRLHASFSLDAFHQDSSQLLAAVKMEVTEARQFQRIQNTA
jgi:hypothetical protein